MRGQFDSIVAKMPKLLSQLLDTTPLSRDRLQRIPERGVYVLYEDDTPIYVGRSNRLRQRLLEHSRPSSLHNSAPFAFNLAKEEAGKRGIDLQGKQRSQMANDPRFVELFKEAKQRVAAMKVRSIEITHPIEQTLFEVYAALALQTPYNDFDTH
ncbi:MAG: hypothetical protein KJ624_06640 [Chloroflexi bacterium]|nr:hypothetical protein [Chloroflexota bacterium]